MRCVLKMPAVYRSPQPMRRRADFACRTALSTHTSDRTNVELRSLVHPGRRAAMDRAVGMTAQAVKAMTAPVPVLAAVGVVPLAPLLALVDVVAARPAL